MAHPRMRRGGIGSALRRLSPAVAALVAGFFALVLLVYVLGAEWLLGALLWVVVGAFIGWLGSLVMWSDTQGAIAFDLLAGGAGALLALLLFGGGSVGEGGPLERFLAAVMGAVALLAMTALARRGQGVGRWLPGPDSNRRPFD